MNRKLYDGNGGNSQMCPFNSAFSSLKSGLGSDGRSSSSWCDPLGVLKVEIIL